MAMTKNPPRQATIERSFALQGVGIHSGCAVQVQVEPAPADHGLRFMRVDLSAAIPIPARAEHVADSSYATSLERAGQRIGTVEHLLAAFYGLQIDNALVCVAGPELPALDGSALPWAQALQRAGRRRQAALCRQLAVREGFRLEEPPRLACAWPADGLQLAVRIDFPHPMLRQGRFELACTPRRFLEELAWARTFTLEDQVERLRQAGLARGGSLDNAVVFGAQACATRRGCAPRTSRRATRCWTCWGIWPWWAPGSQVGWS